MDSLKDYNFWALVAYLLPGLFMVQARNLAARGRFAPITKESSLAFVLVTAVYALVLWASGVALQSATLISGLDPYALFKYFILLPTFLGFVYGLLERYWIVQRLLVPFGINAPLPFESVFGDIFPKQRAGTYVIVMLKDGRQYNGMITQASRFSSNPDKCDLYLGQTYSLTDWTPANPQTGVFIRGDEIQSIEIIDPET